MSTANPNSTTKSPRISLAREDVHSKRVPLAQIPWRKLGIYVVLALGFLVLGAVPMWMRARENAAQLELVQRELGLSQMENRLSEAVIDARRGNYEPARQTASDFFTALRNRVDRGKDSDASATQRDALRNLLAQRDDIITLLARSDPAAADRLSNLYVAYRQTMSGVQPQIGSTRCGYNCLTYCEVEI